MPVRALGLHAPMLERARRLRTRDGRREAGRYLVEGPTLLADALAAGLEPAAVYLTASALAALDPALRRAVEALPCHEVPDRALARLSEVESPSGIVAELPLTLLEPPALFAEAAGDPVAILAGVGDPGNAGTLVRTAEIFGIRHLLFAEGGVEPYHPKVVRAGMGGHFRCRLAAGSGDAVVAAAAEAAYVVVAADRTGSPLPAFDFPARCALAVGGERRGVAGALPGWDRSVSIPHRGDGESLNAAVAGAILFYALSTGR